jgi:hypothetical protein
MGIAKIKLIDITSNTTHLDPIKICRPQRVSSGLSQ